MHFTKEEDYKAWVAKQENGAIAGSLLVPPPEDYVGAMPAINAVLYFQNGYTKKVKAEIAKCFNDYLTIAKEHLTWQWQEDPPKGAGEKTISFKSAKPIEEIFSKYEPYRGCNLLYTSGKQRFATGAWEFVVSTINERYSKEDGDLSCVTFAVPVEWVVENTKDYINLFIKSAERLKVIHGYAGFTYVMTKIRDTENEPTQSALSRQFVVMDVGDPVMFGSVLSKGIKMVNWLTAINYEWFNKIMKEEALNSELPMSWFIGYDYGTGVVIQAGNLPLDGDVNEDPLPAPYVLLNRILKPLRVEKIGSVHFSIHKVLEAPLIKGILAENWLGRYDIEDSEKIDYLAKLQSEPKLNSKYAFLDKRINWNH